MLEITFLAKGVNAGIPLVKSGPAAPGFIVTVFPVL